MCCAPIGLLHYKHLDNLAEDATQVSRITHYDPRCVGGCIAVATCIALLIRGEHDEAISRAALAGGDVSDDVRAVIERGANKKPEELHVDGDDMGYVLVLARAGLLRRSPARPRSKRVCSRWWRAAETPTPTAASPARSWAQKFGAKGGRSRIAGWRSAARCPSCSRSAKISTRSGSARTNRSRSRCR